MPEAIVDARGGRHEAHGQERQRDHLPETDVQRPERLAHGPKAPQDDVHEAEREQAMDAEERRVALHQRLVLKPCR